MKAADNGHGVLIPYSTEIIKLPSRNIYATVMVADASDGFHESWEVFLPQRGIGRAPWTKTEPRRTSDEARKIALIEIQNHLTGVISFDTDSVNVNAAKSLMALISVMMPTTIQLQLF